MSTNWFNREIQKRRSNGTPNGPTITIRSVTTGWRLILSTIFYGQDVSLLDYNGPELVVTTLLSLALPKDARILDIGTGTGSVGCLLHRNGYTNIDGLDATPEMLEIAKQKNCYQNLINSYVTKDTILPIEDKTYDAVIMAGCLCPGHIKWDSFGQIVRIVKPGIYILNLICVYFL